MNAFEIEVLAFCSENIAASVLLQPENEKPVVEIREDEMSHEKARLKLKSPISKESSAAHVQVQFLLHTTTHYKAHAFFCVVQLKPDAARQARYINIRLNKFEVNLRRLSEAAPHQQNQAVCDCVFNSVIV